jgi:cytochrome P450
LGQGIFTQEDAEWLHSRKLLRPIFSSLQVPDLDILESHVQLLLLRIFEKIDDKSHQTKPMRMLELFMNLATDSATGFLLGHSTTSQANTYDHLRGKNGMTFSKGFDTALYYLGRRARLTAFYWVLNPPRFREACSVVKEVTSKIIKDAIDARAENGYTCDPMKNVLSLLLEQGENPERSRDQLLNLLLAGTDTTASFMAWIFLSLAREPHVYAKLRAEIIEILGKSKERTPTREDLERMTYLGKVMDESMCHCVSFKENAN